MLERGKPESPKLKDIPDPVSEEPVRSQEPPEWQKRELDRASEEYEADPDEGSEWPEVEARIRAGHRDT